MTTIFLLKISPIIKNSLQYSYRKTVQDFGLGLIIYRQIAKFSSSPPHVRNTTS